MAGFLAPSGGTRGSLMAQRPPRAQREARLSCFHAQCLASPAPGALLTANGFLLTTDPRSRLHF